MPSRLPEDAETVIFFVDGSAFIAVRPGWEDIETSPTGAGATRGEALEQLLAEERRPRFQRAAQER